MPLWCILIFFLNQVSFSSTAQENSYNFNWPKTGKVHSKLTDSVTNFVDNTKQLHINEVKLIFEKGYKTHIPTSIDYPLNSWFSFKVSNLNNESIKAFATFCSKADQVLVYEYSMDKLVRSTTLSSKQAPRLKQFPSQSNHYLFNVEPNEEKQFIVCYEFNKAVSTNHLKDLVINDYQTLNRSFWQKNIIQSFYFGVMLMFALLSIFTFLLFKGTKFLYFAGLQVAFALYSAQGYGLLGNIFTYHWAQYQYHILELTISLIVFFNTYFMYNYMQVRVKMPKYYWFSITFSWAVALFAHAMNITVGHQLFVPIFNNYLLITWIIIIIIPVVTLTLKKQKEAINLSLAIGLLFFASLIFVFAHSGLLPLNNFTEYGFQLGTLLFSLLVFYGLFENVQKLTLEKADAHALSKLRNKFFTTLTHEFRTPLTLITSPIEEVLKKSLPSEQTRLLNLANNNAQKLNHLINQILDLTKLEHGNMSLAVSESNIVAFAKGITLSFESLAQQKNIQLHFVSQRTELNMWFDAEKMEIILYNLISNALKFTSAYGEVSVMILDHTHEIEMIIRDNGDGIDEKDINLIFESFYQSNQNASQAHGTGIGLAIVKEFVLIHKGRINVNSQLKNGTEFHLFLKKGNEHFAENEISGSKTQIPSQKLNPNALETNYDSYAEQNLNENVSYKSNILLIEDNLDVAEYVKLQLKENFNISICKNGAEGISKAINTIPDLIICDVMMPIKDGFEVVGELRSNSKTSHIPIIMLTALASEQERLKGLSLGVDDFLTKPFKADELKVRVTRLIENRSKLKDQIINEPLLNINSLKNNKTDYDFIVKVNEHLEANLDNSQYTINELAESMNLSRVHLNRRIKSIAGIGTNKYLNQMRLKKALDLLEEQKLNVTEVAELTGFSSTAYFVRKFKEHFGKTPGSLLKGINDDD
jgi:signal transduction histidine kinase/DNA-binding response OmpR family regulator